MTDRAYDPAALDRWLTTEPEATCTTCSLPYDQESRGCEEHTEYRIERGDYAALPDACAWHGGEGDSGPHCPECAENPPRFGRTK